MRTSSFACPRVRWSPGSSTRSHQRSLTAQGAGSADPLLHEGRPKNHQPLPRQDQAKPEVQVFARGEVFPERVPPPGLPTHEGVGSEMVRADQGRGPAPGQDLPRRPRSPGEGARLGSLAARSWGSRSPHSPAAAAAQDSAKIAPGRRASSASRERRASPGRLRGSGVPSGRQPSVLLPQEPHSRVAPGNLRR